MTLTVFIEQLRTGKLVMPVAAPVEDGIGTATEKIDETTDRETLMLEAFRRGVFDPATVTDEDATKQIEEALKSP